MPDHTQRSRPRSGPFAVALIAGAAVVAAWVPSFIATAYAENPASGYLANPAAGWGFLWEAVTASRNPRLGTADAAMQQASQVWAGAPAVADEVSLRALPPEWTVPVPVGAWRRPLLPACIARQTSSWKSNAVQPRLANQSRKAVIVAARPWSAASCRRGCVIGRRERGVVGIPAA